MKPRKKKSTSIHRKRFPIEIALLGGILLLLVAGAASILRGSEPAQKSQGPSGTPRLMVDQELADLGDIQLGKTVNISFTLTNAGDAPLKITDDPFVEVKEGC